MVVFWHQMWLWQCLAWGEMGERGILSTLNKCILLKGVQTLQRQRSELNTLASSVPSEQIDERKRNSNSVMIINYESSRGQRHSWKRSCHSRKTRRKKKGLGLASDTEQKEWEHRWMRETATRQGREEINNPLTNYLCVYWKRSEREIHFESKA
jgi:hypothetical protein